ncbi:MAG: hypothetical protein NAOJABEB_00647 [Steroidobacteraceae bacterium]|nr:hypothetical protein [Steroidobacteraceae bacterium]
MSQRVFRWCTVGAALIVAGAAVYFLATYIAASIAIGSSGLEPFYQQSVRAMWLGFCAQLGLLALVMLYAAAYPRSVSRQFVLVLALMPLLSTVLLFSFAASRIGAWALAAAAVLMLAAASTWPARTPDDTSLGAQAVRFPGGPRAP